MQLMHKSSIHKLMLFVYICLPWCPPQFNSSRADIKVYATCVRDAANWNLLGQPGETRDRGGFGSTWAEEGLAGQGQRRV
jgi:hypothetical protein